jgi:hypothetical protein
VKAQNQIGDRMADQQQGIQAFGDTHQSHEDGDPQATQQQALAHLQQASLLAPPPTPGATQNLTPH